MRARNQAFLFFRDSEKEKGAVEKLTESKYPIHFSPHLCWGVRIVSYLI